MTNHVLGIDGARGGWMVADLDTSVGTVTFGFEPQLAPVLARLVDDVSTIAIDMPIGLSANGDRPADTEARRRLGPRRSTFFPTPIRAVLDSADYPSANEISKEVSGKGLSKQAWYLVPKILEIDAIWTREISDRLYEAHPELSFSEMAGAVVTAKKTTNEGRSERVSLLTTHLSASTSDALSDVPARFMIDAIDACALAWTARRVQDGAAILIGGDLDPAGRPMRLAI